MTTEPTIPDLTPVQSSNIAATGHDGKDLYVQFHGGALWKYPGVSAVNYNEMLGSGSVGRYHAQFIKPNHKGERIS